jgi:GAF domain-containing protein
VTAVTLPESVLHYVLRTRESVILDNAAAQPLFASDPYIRQHQLRSVLCLPLITQARLIGVLFLENNLAPRVFAPARIAVLKLLALAGGDRAGECAFVPRSRGTRSQDSAHSRR